MGELLGDPDHVVAEYRNLSQWWKVRTVGVRTVRRFTNQSENPKSERQTDPAPESDQTRRCFHGLRRISRRCTNIWEKCST